MPGERRRNAEIAIDKVRIGGLAPPVRATGLRQAIASGLRDQLADAAVLGDGPARVMLQGLKLRLPHTADSKDIARALSEAVVRSLRGKRS